MTAANTTTSPGSPLSLPYSHPSWSWSVVWDKSDSPDQSATGSTDHLQEEHFQRMHTLKCQTTQMSTLKHKPCLYLVLTWVFFPDLVYILIGPTFPEMCLHRLLKCLLSVHYVCVVTRFPGPFLYANYSQLFLQNNIYLCNQSIVPAVKYFRGRNNYDFKWFLCYR